MTKDQNKFDINYTVVQIPVVEIYFDHQYNCREPFTLASVIPIADSINNIGLQTPVTVCPCLTMPSGFKYRLVSGYRRFTACSKILQWETVPAFVRTDFNEHQASLYNLTENIDRKDLTIYEEAQALLKVFPEKTPIRQMAKILKRSPLWIRRRLLINELPAELQAAIRSGLLKPTDLDIIGAASKSKQMVVAQRLIHEKQASRHKRKNIAGAKNLRPKMQKIKKMARYLEARGVRGLVIRVLDWSAGLITDTDLYQYLNKMFKKIESAAELASFWEFTENDDRQQDKTPSSEGLEDILTDGIYSTDSPS